MDELYDMRTPGDTQKGNAMDMHKSGLLTPPNFG
jgi:hypothetical protein